MAAKPACRNPSNRHQNHRSRSRNRRGGWSATRAFGRPPDNRNEPGVCQEGDDNIDDLPERSISAHPNDVTREGLAQIETEVNDAQKALAAAQGAGDRPAIARASRDLRYWSARRGTANVAPQPQDNNQVRFGHTVTIIRDDGRGQTYRIVGEDEADPAQGSISLASPLAQALFGKRVGDVVPVGAGKAEILKIV